MLEFIVGAAAAAMLGGHSVVHHHTTVKQEPPRPYTGPDLSPRISISLVDHSADDLPDDAYDYIGLA